MKNKPKQNNSNMINELDGLIKKARNIFQQPEIADVFLQVAKGWTTSKGKSITSKQRDELIKKYLGKEQQGEYITKLEKTELIRSGAVAKACITLTKNGQNFVLIRTPSATHLRNWKLVGGKQSNQDRISSTSEVYQELARQLPDDEKFSTEEIVHLLITTLRELNEELPIPAHIGLSSGKVIAWHEQEVKLLSIEDLPSSEMFVRISPLDFETHVNRNSETEGKERYPGITRRSKLMFTHGELIDVYGLATVKDPISLNDGSGVCRWIPLTSSVCHWLSKAPLKILPDNLLTRKFNIPAEPIVNLQAHHINSLIESYLEPNRDGANKKSLDKILEKKIKLLDDRKQLITGAEKQTFDRLIDKDKEKEHRKLNLAKDYRLIDNEKDGFAVIHKSEIQAAEGPKTMHAMHMRADQLLLFRAAGKWWSKGWLPHNIRYQQAKRTKRAILLHEYDALYTAVRNKMEEEGKKDNLGHENAVEGLANRLSTNSDDVEITQTNPPLFKLPTLNSGKVVDVTIRDFTEINLDLLKRHINAWPYLTNESGNKISDEVVEFAHSRIGKMSWKNLMERTQVSYTIMQQTSCKECGVDAGIPCTSSTLGPLVAEKRKFGHITMDRYQPQADHGTLALADHILRDFTGLMGDLYNMPHRDIWKSETSLGIVSGNVESFRDNQLSDGFKAQKKRMKRPILPFSCVHRFEAACKPSVGWEDMVKGHLNPLKRVAKSGNKSKGGNVRLYLSGKETEPPFLMQNLVADVVKREYTLMRALNPKRLSLPHGKPRWNERLLWEHITPSSNGSITTLPLDAPLEQWPTKSRNIPLLRFEKVASDVAATDRFNRKDKQSAKRPNHHLVPQAEHWHWTREATDQPLEGLLPIVSPDLSMGELLDIAAINGIGVAVAIDAWSATGLAENDITYGEADTDWFITSELFGPNEPPVYRTYGSFLGALNSNEQLNIERDQVMHERRIFGVILLDELLNMQWTK